MTHPLITRIQSQLAPLQPLPTDVTPRLMPLTDVKAVLFDLYGTLMISASGDIGVGSDPRTRVDALVDALQASGAQPKRDAAALVEMLHAQIHDSHELAHADGVIYPEVDIREIWRQMVEQGGIEPPPGEMDEADDWLEQLAVEYEVRVNPVWPMPGAVDCLRAASNAHHVLGIVSNAQFFTPWMWLAATGLTLEQAGFDPLVQYFSYVHRCAKPGLTLYQLAASALGQRGISPAQTLYVGNDIRNDVAPAAAVGFRTALFAGDRRSLRLREDQSELRDVRPDVVLTDLKQLTTALGT